MSDSGPSGPNVNIMSKWSSFWSRCYYEQICNVKRLGIIIFTGRLRILIFEVKNKYVSKSHACFESEWYNSLGRLQLYLIWLNDHFQVFIFEHIHSYTYLFFSLQRLRVTQPHHFRHKIVEKTSKLIGWYLIWSKESSTLNWLIRIIR